MQCLGTCAVTVICLPDGVYLLVQLSHNACIWLVSIAFCQAPRLEPWKASAPVLHNCLQSVFVSLILHG